MTDPFAKQKVENWVSDFLASDRARDFGGGVREHGEQVLTELLWKACQARGVAAEQLEERDLRFSFLGPVAALQFPDSVRTEVPDLAAACLEFLQDEGRLADGRQLGLFLRALRRPFDDAATGRQRPDRRPAPKLGPNDPCPCGSGRKYKKCCQA